MRHASNRASEVGHPCLRYHAANRLLGHLRPPIETALEGIFARGRSYEDYMGREGFRRLRPEWRIVSTQGELYDHGLDLSGHYDFVINDGKSEIIVDTKSMMGGQRMDSWDRIQPRFRSKYRAQLEVYIRLSGLSRAGLWIGDAALWHSGHLVECGPDDELWAQIQDRCRRLADIVVGSRTVAAADLLEYVATVPGLQPGACECAGCPWLETVGCSRHWSGLTLADDPALEADLHRWSELRELAQEWQALDESIKARLAQLLPNGGEGLVGTYSVERRPHQVVRWTAPKSLQEQFEQYRITTTQYRVKVKEME
jgi:hypothetical protein